MHASASSIFSGPITHLLSALWVLMKILSHASLWKRRQKGLRVSNLALLLVVFKWYHGSEGVKNQLYSANTPNYVREQMFAQLRTGFTDFDDDDGIASVLQSSMTAMALRQHYRLWWRRRYWETSRDIDGDNGVTTAQQTVMTTTASLKTFQTLITTMV